MLLLRLLLLLLLFRIAVFLAFVVVVFPLVSKAISTASRASSVAHWYLPETYHFLQMGVVLAGQFKSSRFG